MKVKYTIIFLIIAILVGCVKKETLLIESKLLINKIPMDDDIVVPLSYYKVKSADTQTYLLMNDNIEKYDEVYLHACIDIVPSKAIKRISQKLNFEKSFQELKESLIKYSSQKDYEAFFVEAKDGLSWKIYILDEGKLNEMTINHNKEMNIQDVQIDENVIYIYSEKIYKINLIDYSTEVILDVKEKLGLDGTGNKVFIKDNICVLSINSSSSKSKGNKGLLIKYDLDRETLLTVDEKDRINQIFPYKNGFVATCSQNDTWDPIVKYYDSEFNLTMEKKLNIDSQFGHVTFPYYGNLVYIFNDKIYTCMEVDGSHIEEIVIIDIESSEILYQLEISYKDRQGFILSGPSFYKLNNGKLINLKKF
ncbi:hypothetical protein SH1V18_15790 [Vallitalea longa]|uniref:Lipoprotein n=1 Tax=Vallitalea longa TaxID=2936439 RepID=A0A9W5Y9L6_9FIRM|nr:hypothetical protein [Vallitalea longa]GKX29099.1 hypothetical protein SH1V18_15790 [Vallitalea longa]